MAESREEEQSRTIELSEKFREEFADLMVFDAGWE